MLQKPASNRSALLRYAFVLPVAALLTMCTQPEKELTATEQPIAGEIYTVVEKQPEFPGGMAALGNYMSKTIKYPAAAERANVSGRVYVSFVVTTTGEIKNVEILKGLGFGTDEEAARVVAAMPHWKPGSQGGTPVNVKYNLPINFSLDGTPPSSNRSSSDMMQDIKVFTVNGKEVTKEEARNVDPNVIVRMDVDKEQGTVAITTK
ncbi:energy transducer TonB [Spirosoma sp. KUDC1026]|uniref:energy transducer TonB n=1 Tax=Spirosoma sp. KUDC1026 TaxID=2745947 RepID=UPI00159BD3C6|nr:energy transducer TonB [Spirosoma sp. KUDC1026]QKZ11201.1 energy transducer TonB [Spirosoma sp. KUDC1026]